MNITIPPTDTEKNIQSIKFAMDRKASEVEQAQRKLDDLRAELRGLKIALETLEGKPTPRAESTGAIWKE